MMLRRPHYRLLRAGAKFVRTKTVPLRLSQAIISFTFDDVPDSAFTRGAPVLERRGVRGTFYIASGTFGLQDEHWRVIEREQARELPARGHELGAHTCHHRNVQLLSARGLADEAARNDDELAELCGGRRPRSFAYPFGDASLPRKLQLERRYASCRGIYEGINAGRADLGLLKAVALNDSAIDAQGIARRIDDAVHAAGWLIFYTHDVADPPSWIGCSPALLDQAIAMAQSRDLECLTVGAATDRIRQSAQGRSVDALAAPASAD